MIKIRHLDPSLTAPAMAAAPARSAGGVQTGFGRRCVLLVDVHDVPARSVHDARRDGGPVSGTPSHGPSYDVVLHNVGPLRRHRHGCRHAIPPNPPVIASETTQPPLPLFIST